ncbi:SseB family protein [uncultured Litoreibacter sp.]|uniref:SseB family protein n=1 Tax=uncultured Litoreibacter sp. TaxID=1392394 RepID=UPI00260973F0|nr:SseB family protein [uncultured Litoreibacter sp.]
MTALETPLDQAHAAMDRSDTDRLRFYERLADAELFLLLDRPPEGDQITPRVFPMDDATLVLAFDREERLAEFAGAAPYAALSGRALVAMLSAQDLGLGLNLEVAPSSIVLPQDAIGWLNDTLGNAPSNVEATPEELLPPASLPEALVTGLDIKLALAGGLARTAYLCSVRYTGGAQSHMLAFLDPMPGAEPALARAVNEALIFSGIDAGMLDVAFFAASNPMSASLAKVGLRFDLPEPEQPTTPSPPGMDPGKPPKLT